MPLFQNLKMNVQLLLGLKLTETEISSQLKKMANLNLEVCQNNQAKKMGTNNHILLFLEQKNCTDPSETNLDFF